MQSKAQALLGLHMHTALPISAAHTTHTTTLRVAYRVRMAASHSTTLEICTFYQQWAPCFLSLQRGQGGRWCS